MGLFGSSPAERRRRVMAARAAERAEAEQLAQAAERQAQLDQLQISVGSSVATKSVLLTAVASSDEVYDLYEDEDDLEEPQVRRLTYQLALERLREQAHALAATALVNVRYETVYDSSYEELVVAVYGDALSAAAVGESAPAQP